MTPFTREKFLAGLTGSLFMTVVMGWSPSLAMAVTVTLGAGKVATIFENQPDHSIGRGPAVFIGGDSSGSPRRGLIDFNIAANLPAGATITSASLTMYLGLVGGTESGTPDSTPRTIDLQRITSDWAHGPTGLGVTTISGTDQGFAAIPPSPTWDERRYQQDQPWTTPGGDFSTTISASTAVGQAVDQAYTWQSNPQLVADVQLMLDHPSVGFGWILRNVDERVPGSERALLTKDWSNPLLRPQLLISYDPAPVPLPAAAWLFGSGALVMAGARRLTRARFGCVALIMVALLGIDPAGAATITLSPNHDATIYGASSNQGVPNTDGQDLFNRSNGAGPGLFSGGNGALAPHRALLSFDIADNVPIGATITGVQLTLHIGIVAGSGGAAGLGDQTPRIMDLHRVTADWGEGTTGANATTIGGTGQGFPANPGDATWNARHFGSMDWTTPGGDFVPTVSGSAVVGSEFFSAQTWHSTPQMVADAQDWLTHPNANYGWILINQDEHSKQTHRAFFSREAEAEGVANAIGPQLQIEYTVAPVPLPAAIWFFGSGLAALAGIARRKVLSEKGGIRGAK